LSVPCGVKRDYDFATKTIFNIPIPNIFKDGDISQEACVCGIKKNTIITNSDLFRRVLLRCKPVILRLKSLETLGQGQGK